MGAGDIAGLEVTDEDSGQVVITEPDDAEDIDSAVSGNAPEQGEPTGPEHESTEAAITEDSDNADSKDDTVSTDNAETAVATSPEQDSTPVEEETPVPARSKTSLKPLGLGGGSVDVEIHLLDISSQPWADVDNWDYIREYAYVTNVTIMPTQAVDAGTKRTVTLTAPDGMRFLSLSASSIPASIQSVTYKNVDGISNHQAVIELKDSTYGAGITLGFTTVNKSLGDTNNNSYTPSYVGKAVRDAAMAGEPRPKYTTTADCKEGSIEGSVSKTVGVKFYEQDEIFDGFQMYTLGSVNEAGGQDGKQKRDNLRINVYGEIGQKNIYGVFETDRFFYLDNEVDHEPYWDLSMKIYIPEGLKIGPDGPYDKVQTEPGTGRKYILWTDINGTDPDAPAATKTSIITNMENPRTNIVSVSSSGSNPNVDMANYLGQNLNNGVVPATSSTNAVFGCDLDLQLDEAISSGAIYPMDIEIGYKTGDPSEETATRHHDQSFTYYINTDVFTKVDKYNINVGGQEYSTPRSTVFDLPEALSSVDTMDWYQYVRINSSALETDFNDNHVGGTLKIEPGTGYELYSVRLPNVTSAKYYMTGDDLDGSGRNAPLVDSEKNTFEFTDAKDSGRVVKVVLTFGEGLKLKNGARILLSFGLRTLELTGADATAGFKKSNMKITLRGAHDDEPSLDGCNEYSGNGVSNGQHEYTTDFYIRKSADDLIVQVYGAPNHLPGGGSGPRKMPWLSGVGGIGGEETTNGSAFVAFGHSNGLNAEQTGYIGDRTGEWINYKNFSIDLSGELTLSTFSGTVVLNKFLYYKDAKFAYTTNDTSGVSYFDIDDVGKPYEYETGEEQTVHIPLASGDYFTSLKFMAGEFMPLGVKFGRAGYSSADWDNPVGNHWGFSNYGGRIEFKSKTDRDFPDGTPIKDYRTEDSSYPFGASYDADEISISRAAMDYAPFPVQFSLAASDWNEVYGYGSGHYYNSPAVQGNLSISQSQTFNISVSIIEISMTSHYRIRGCRLILKINPDFAYVGDNPNIRQVTKDGYSYLVIGETTEITNGSPSITLQMKALPTAKAGTNNVFLDGWGDFTDTLDFELQSKLPPYTVPFFVNETDIKNSGNWQNDPLDIDDDGRTDDILLRMRNATTTVLAALNTGLQLMPGVGASLAAETRNTIFDPTEADKLTAYIAIGGSSTVLTNYESILHLPAKGEDVTYFDSDKNEDVTVKSAYDIKLTGAIDKNFQEVPTAVSYKKGGSWFNEAATSAWNDSDWNAVTDIKLEQATFPAMTTISLNLPLKLDGDILSIDNHSRAYLSAMGSYEGNANLKPAPAVYTLEFPNHSITFTSGDNGSLTADGNTTAAAITDSAIEHATVWGDFYDGSTHKVPTPVADDGYYFAGWNPVIPESSTTILEDKTYTASFAPKKDITIEMGSKQSVYDGTTQNVTVTAILTGSALVSGHAIDTLTAGAAGLIGDNATTVSAFTLKDALDSSVNIDTYYNVSYTYGNFAIAKRPITVKPVDRQKMYDGTELTPGAIEIAPNSPYVLAEGDALLDSHALVTTPAAYTGSQTNAGSSDSNVTDVIVTHNLVPAGEYYDITYAPGTLTVTANDTLRAAATGLKVEFDSAAHSISDASANVDGADLLFSVTENGTYTKGLPEDYSYTNAGKYPVWVKAAKDNYVTSPAVLAEVEIAKRPITITVDDKSKVYDGSKLEADSVSISKGSLLPGHSLDMSKAVFTGAQTGTGDSESAVSGIGIAGTLTANYDITYAPGTLTVTANDTLTVTATGTEVVYDADAHHIAGATANIDDATLLYSATENGTYTKGLPEDYSYTDVGTYPVWVKASKANYTDSPSVKAEVKITARPITVKVDDLAKQYDGKALEPMSVSVIQGSLAHEGHKIELSKAAFTGSQKAVGSSQSTVTGVTVSGTKAENYIITHAPGTLKVAAAPKQPKPKKPTPEPPTPTPTPPTPPVADVEPVAGTTPAAIEEPEEVVTRPPTNTDVDVARTVTEPAEPKTTEFSPEDQAKIEAQTGNPVTDIIKGNVPRGSFMSTAVWSLLSLIMSLAAVIITLCLIIGSLLARRRRDDDPEVYGEDRDEERRNQRKGLILKVFACAIGVITAVLWLVLDDLSQPMAWINRWTVLVGIAFVLHIAALIAYKVRKKTARENGDEQEAA